MLKVGSKFYTFDELSKRLEEFQQIEQVQLWVRDSRTVVAAAKRARRKSLNPALKYAELTYSCVFGGRRPSDQTKTHNQTSAGGCPFKVRLSTSNDGQALVVKEICHDHNHEPGKKLHEEPRRLYKNKTNNRAGVRKPVRYLVNKQRTSSTISSPATTCLSPKTRLPQTDATTTAIRLAHSPFHHLQLHNQQQQQQIKIQLEQHLQQQRIRQQQLEIIQLDSPDHIDTPDHLSSPDLSSTYEHLGNIITTTEQYSYLPPSPISPSSLSSSGQTGDSSGDEEAVEPIIDLDVALEEALGDLESVSSMDLEDKFSFSPMSARTVTMSRPSDSEPSLSAIPLSASPSTSSAIVTSNPANGDPCAPPPAKRFRGRPRKHSFTGSTIGGGVDIPDLVPAPFNEMESDDDDTDFIGFSPVRNEDNATDQLSASDIEQANAMAKQLHVFKPGINFVTGAKLEVLDARDNKWYQCRVVQVDWGELDILVHYERWSVRFDEWLKMDSTRIKPLSRSKEKSKQVFKVGEKVLGYWAPDSKYYFGQIKKHLSEDNYEVQFYDGYTKHLRSSQLKKITNPKQYSGIDIKKSPKLKHPHPASSSSALPPVPAPEIEGPEVVPHTRRRSESAVLYSPPASPTPVVSKVEKPEVLAEVDASASLSADLLNAKRNIFNVEILEEKRKTKRKPDVEELFKSRKKRKFDDMSDVGMTSQIKTKTPSSVPSKPKIKKDHIVEESVEKVRTPEPSSFPTSEGMPSRNINYFEVDIGHGWKKVCNRRLHGIWTGKWDVYFVTADNRKIRTRQELVKYCTEHATHIRPTELNFSVRSAKSKYDEANQGKGDMLRIKQDVQSDEEQMPSTQEREAVDDTPVDNDEEYDEEDEDYDDGRDDLINSSDDETDDESLDGDKKIPFKDIVKKRQSSSSESELESSPEKPSVSSVRLSHLMGDNIRQAKSPQDSFLPTKKEEDLSPSIGTKMTLPKPKIYKEPKTPALLDSSPSFESSHKCPKKTCEKSFRKENLLQMHMKHYHPELLKKRSLQAPNVADLAYARTVGDHLDVASQSPSSHSFPSVDFMVPDKRTEALRKPMSEGKKSGEKRTHGRLSKEGKKEGFKFGQAEISDSEDGNDMDVVNDLRDEEEMRNKSESELHKSKLSQKKQKEKLITRAETTRRRSRKSESIADEDPYDKKTARSQTSKRRSLPGLRSSVSVPSGSEAQPDIVEHQEEENADGWNEPQSDYQDAIIHCGCKSQEEDGLMLQCDVCLTWQHGGCYNIESEEQVPEKYICSLCENPRGQRSSMRFRHHQEWLKEGKLPRFSFSTSKPNLKLESCLRRGHELSANVLQLSQLLHSLRLKLHISKEDDHPKFVMWHKEWKDFEDKKNEEQNLEQKLDQNIPHSQMHDSTPVQDFMQSFNQPVPQLATPEAYLNPNFKNDLPPFVPLTSQSEIISNEVLSKDFALNNVSKDGLLSGSVIGNEQHFKTEGSDSAIVNEQHFKGGEFAQKPELNVTSEVLNEFPLGKPLETVFSNQDSDIRNEENIDTTISKSEKVPKTEDSAKPIEQDEKVSTGEQFLGIKAGDISSMDVVENKMGDISIKKPEDLTTQIEATSEDVNKEESVENKPLQSSTPTEELVQDKSFNLKLEMDSIPKEDIVEDLTTKEELEKKIDKSDDTSVKGTEGTQDSLEDTEDFDLDFRALGGSGASINVGLVDLLSSHTDLEQLVGSELPSLVHNPIPVATAPIIPKNERIEPKNCKLNLLKHVEQIQDKVFERFDIIEEEIKALEAEMGLTSEISREEEQLLNSDEGEDRDAVTMQARSLVQLILRDIDTVKKLSEFS